MLKKVALTAITVAAVLGTGGAALAASGTTTPANPASSTPAGTAGAAAKPAAGKHHHLKLADMRGVAHASWVTGKTGAFVTHQAIRGTVNAVSATSITVTAADKFSATYTVSSTTKVHTRANHKDAVIADVKVGDEVAVSGTGATDPAATQVVDTKK